MNADFLFETGDSHKICEDYGRHGNYMPDVRGGITNDGYIVQSDGCSDPKSPDTDFGSRLLVKAAENFLVAGVLHNGEGAVAAAQAQARAIGLHPNCLDATLIVARTFWQYRKTEVKMWGDGVVAGLRRDGSVRLYVVESPPSPSGSGTIPFYISYTLDTVRLGNYQAAGVPNLITTDFHPDDTYTNASSTDITTYPTVLDFPHDEFSYVATFSDGAESFYFRDPKNGQQIGVPVEQVVLPLVRFVGYAGEFVRRQYNIFNNPKIGAAGKGAWKHYDDFSYGGIYHGELPK